MIDVHGYNWGRGLEAYNNTFYASVGYGAAQAFWIRGGGGNIFNNTIINCLYGVMLYNETVPPYAVSDIYVWDDVGINTTTMFTADSRIIENVDYFLYARPNYTPYTYPHPLTLEATP